MENRNSSIASLLNDKATLEGRALGNNGDTFAQLTNHNTALQAVQSLREMKEKGNKNKKEGRKREQLLNTLARRNPSHLLTSRPTISH